MNAEDLTPYLDKNVTVTLVHADENGPVVRSGPFSKSKAMPGMFEVLSAEDGHSMLWPLDIATIEEL